MTPTTPDHRAIGRTISLPWPPTVNTYWRHVMIGRSPRVLLSAKGREYREAAVAEAIDSSKPPMLGRLAVRIAAYPPDRRKRDLDNLLKPILDALAHAGVYEDDGQIDSLSIHREAFDPDVDGFVLVCIEPVGAARPVTTAANGDSPYFIPAPVEPQP